MDIKTVNNNKKMLRKRASRQLVKSGVYSMVESMVTPKCDICPNSGECRFFETGAKCKIKKAYYKSALNFFASLPFVRQEHALMVDIFAQEWFHRFWVMKFMYSDKIDGSQLERLDRVRDRSTKNMLGILRRFGLSPNDQIDKGLEDTEIIRILKDKDDEN